METLFARHSVVSHLKNAWTLLTPATCTALFPTLPQPKRRGEKVETQRNPKSANSATEIYFWPKFELAAHFSTHFGLPRRKIHCHPARVLYGLGDKFKKTMALWGVPVTAVWPLNPNSNLNNNYHIPQPPKKLSPDKSANAEVGDRSL